MNVFPNITLFLLFFVSGLQSSLALTLLNEDGKLNFTELAAKYGFPNAVTKDVVTDDGYILALHHIPGDRRRPVLLVHGNSLDASCWIVRGNSSLSIRLARKGYDVWAINSRGTTLSKRHLFLDANTQKREFFNYTFYEQGIYDMPATIDYILKETKQKSLLAIGHSIGTTNFFVLGSVKPEYNNKIKAFISLAPISFIQNLRGLARVGSLLGKALTGVGLLIGAEEIAGKNGLVSGVFNATCLGPLRYTLCVEGVIFPLFGPDARGLERDFVRTLFGHFPEGSSRKLFDHLIQIIERNKFAKYDYGCESNLVEYGTEEPPEFDLSQVSMKVALFMGSNDYLASVPDAERLRDDLPNVVHYQVMPYEDFNHIDFVWGREMPTNLYPYLMPVIEKYMKPKN
ncbi:lipase 1-like [Ostrinia furnacalis]|uniref:lipase 1-like n=1 Tax=Ostrinia furnacalis TaxID=93504 RepID=UPI00103F2E9B|nr:lipase 1-like [Ostrinia furnacalis]